MRSKTYKVKRAFIYTFEQQSEEKTVTVEGFPKVTGSKIFADF